jgi:transcriptional regulator with GAF, ATPase, and Fis domain
MQKHQHNASQRNWISISGEKSPPVYVQSIFQKFEDTKSLPFLIETEDINCFDKIVRELRKADHFVSPLTKKILLLKNNKELKKEEFLPLLNEGLYDIIRCDDEKDVAIYLEGLTEKIIKVQSILDSELVTKNLVGESFTWKKFLSEIIEAALFPSGSLLLTGESGSGKEMISRLVHTLDERPGKKDLVLLDCTTIVPELSGSEFFGHERGSYTSAVQSREGAFSLANKGTLFLDEIGDLPFSLQSELLRVIQEGTYKKVGSNNWQKTNFRLVCATHRNIRQQVKEYKFRQDLFFRIADFEFRVPSLKERPEDIILLAEYFLQQHFPEKETPELDEAVKDLLMSREYEGNVRELKQLIQRIAMKHVKHKKITIGEVPREYFLQHGSVMSPEVETANHDIFMKKAIMSGASLWDLKDKAMNDAIHAALELTNGNKKQAAEKLGVTTRAIQQFLKNRNGL